MEKIHWGIIGCGDVTEVKSGPAFNKVNNSELVAVMRRDAARAEDYARRHQVPKWYTDADQLINDPGINAVYVATTPSTHEEFTIKALRAGKPVYVEKPMSVNAEAAVRMMLAAQESHQPLVVAHYRRAQPLFQKIKQLIDEKLIGNIRFARSLIVKRILSKEELLTEKIAWRVNPVLSGGGLFNDLAPHQLDLACYFFGEVERASGFASNQAGKYAADDIVSGTVIFKSGVHFSGVWCFNVDTHEEKDECEIIGENGRIVFSFFDHQPVKIFLQGNWIEYAFAPLQHVQQPMIEKAVEHFLGHAPNPCPAGAGVEVMKLIDRFTRG